MPHAGARFGSGVSSVPGSVDVVAIGASGQDPGGLGAVFMVRVNGSGHAMETV